MADDDGNLGGDSDSDNGHGNPLFLSNKILLVSRPTTNGHRHHHLKTTVLDNDDGACDEYFLLFLFPPFFLLTLVYLDYIQ